MREAILRNYAFDVDQVAPTLADVVVFVAIHHTATHLGQISMWRRAKGMGPVIG